MAQAVERVDDAEIEPSEIADVAGRDDEIVVDRSCSDQRVLIAPRRLAPHEARVDSEDRRVGGENGIELFQSVQPSLDFTRSLGVALA